VDSRPGDYFEFGVAHGNSLKAASIAAKKSRLRSIGVNALPRRIYGFDPFEGFKSSSELDQHGIWTGTRFTHSFEKVSRRFKGDSSVSLHKVDATTLANEKGEIQANHEVFGISEGQKASIILFDMDFFQPTFAALCFMKPLMQQGTFIMFDEISYFDGRRSKGEQYARDLFLSLNPNFNLAFVMTYGIGGIVYSVDVE